MYCYRSCATHFRRKNQSYLKAPSGGPLVQHAVVAMFEAHYEGKISVEKIVEKCAIIRLKFSK
jgi:dihydroorotase-like cyclic amidohydrolase